MRSWSCRNERLSAKALTEAALEEAALEEAALDEAALEEAALDWRPENHGNGVHLRLCGARLR